MTMRRKLVKNVASPGIRNSVRNTVRNMVSDNEYRRICWQSRRGMLELDVLLMPFVQDRFPALSDREQHAYQKMLGHDDPDLINWLLKGVIPEDPDLASLVILIRANHSV